MSNLIVEEELAPQRRGQVGDLCHTWCMDSAVHRGEGARCGSAPCVALLATAEYASTRPMRARYSALDASRSWSDAARLAIREAYLCDRTWQNATSSLKKTITITSLSL